MNIFYLADPVIFHRGQYWTRDFYQ